MLIAETSRLNLHIALLRGRQAFFPFERHAIRVIGFVDSRLKVILSVYTNPPVTEGFNKSLDSTNSKTAGPRWVRLPRSFTMNVSVPGCLTQAN